MITRQAAAGIFLALLGVFCAACERADPDADPTLVEPPDPQIQLDDTVALPERIEDIVGDPEATVDTVPPDRTAPDDVRLLEEGFVRQGETVDERGRDPVSTPGPEWPALIGLTPEEVQEAHGEPRVMLEVKARDGADDKMAWVYFPRDDESTGYYVLFQRGRVAETLVARYTGVRSEPMVSWFEQ